MNQMMITVTVWLIMTMISMSLNVEDAEVARIRAKKKKMHEEILADLEGLRVENGEDWE